MYVDTSNFDLIVDSEQPTVVKFDRKNPHGLLLDEWKTFVKSAAVASIPLLPLEVNCHNEWWWNDESFFNMDLCRRFQVDFPQDYFGFRPKILLFLPITGPALWPAPHNTVVVEFDEVLTSHNLLCFLHRTLPNITVRLPLVPKSLQQKLEGALSSQSELKKTLTYIRRGMKEDYPHDPVVCHYVSGIATRLSSIANQKDKSFDTMIAFLNAEVVRLVELLYPEGVAIHTRRIMEGSDAPGGASVRELQTKLAIASAFKRI